jgi:hypothetical protein
MRLIVKKGQKGINRPLSLMGSCPSQFIPFESCGLKRWNALFLSFIPVYRRGSQEVGGEKVSLQKLGFVMT